MPLFNLREVLILHEAHRYVLRLLQTVPVLVPAITPVTPSCSPVVNPTGLYTFVLKFIQATDDK